MRIRTIIVDDEELARDEMRFFLSREKDVDIVAEAGGGREAVRLVEETRPDLIFLDIQMPEMNGFQVVQALLESGHIPLIVFATAYDRYAIRAFEINALDYLLKPIDSERLRETLNRVRTALPRPDEFVVRVRKLAEGINVESRFLPKIVIQKGEDVALLEVEKVAMLVQEGSSVNAHTEEGNFLTNYSDLDEIDVQLDPAVFLRLGGRYMINLRRISEILPWAGGNFVLVLDDAEKTEVRLNRSQARLLKNKVEGIV